MEGDDDVVPRVRSWEVDVFQSVELDVVVNIVQAVWRLRIFLVVVVLRSSF
jgi:hypothetical protein